MSIYGAMFSGVSGLAAQSQALGMISDNISNINTVGYKRTATRFSTLVTEPASNTRYSPGGVMSSPHQLIDRQGLLQGSASGTDIAISGDGFFVVNTAATPTLTTGEYRFTRAGSFTTDEEGFLRNTAGLFLQAWPVDANGNIPTNVSDLSALRTVNVAGLTGQAEATSSIALKGNLQSNQTVAAAEATYDPTVTGTNMASGAVTPDFVRSLQIYDSLGSTRTLSMAFLKDNVANQWHVEIYVEPASDITAVAPLVDGQVATGTIAFNPDGSLNGAATSPALLSPLNVPWAAALGVTTPQAVDLNLGSDGLTDGLTQFATTSQIYQFDVNGRLFGSLSGISIGEDGFITALFSNGTTRQIYKIPMAAFPNPNALSATTGNAWIETDTSGGVTLFEAGTGGVGKVQSGALESSTVDLAEEFTNMIITQRAYSASGKIITTADEMLEELIRLKR